MKKPLIIGFAFVTILCYFYFNFLGTLSQNVVPVTSKERSYISFFFPQGWGFFTRNPRELKYELYKLSAGHLPELMNYKITSSKNLYGLSREGNRIVMEMIRIQNVLPKTLKWISSDLDADKFVINANRKITVVDSVPGDVSYIKPGNYMMKEYEITPWSWAKYPNNITKKFKYYPFELKY